MLCDNQRVLEECTEEERTEREGQERQKLLTQVSWEKLTLLQKDLVFTRLKLLYYLDTLDTMEDILGGGLRAAERFLPHVYASLRSRAPLESCLRAARQGDALTLQGLLAGHHSPALLAHWLPLLASFPETVAPSSYSCLLPGLEQGGGVAGLWTRPLREQDWAETALVVKYTGKTSGWSLWGEEGLYEGDMVTWLKYKGATPTPSLVAQWYEERARAISDQSSLPCLALDLLQEGLERGVAVDWRLLHNLRTLDSLVYEVATSPSLGLEQLEVLAPEQQMELVVEGWQDQPLEVVRRQLVPFLQRLEDHRPGEMARLLTGFCVQQAVEDLAFPLTVVEHSGPDKAGPLLYRSALAPLPRLLF